MLRSGWIVAAIIGVGCHGAGKLPSGDAGDLDLAFGGAADADAVDFASAGPTDGHASDFASTDLACRMSTGGGGLITFDDVPANTVIRDRYSAMGILFSSTGAGGGPRTFGVYPSPVSSPNYLTGDDESVDSNPGTEYGNNQPALPITITFVDPLNLQRAAVAPSVAFKDVFTNMGNVTRADAYDAQGVKVASAQITGNGSSQTLSLASPSGIHRVVVSFDQAGTGGMFEDNAGIDDVQFSAVTTVCP